jgi:quercetin dioxygenase-like cupin family protein
MPIFSLLSLTHGRIAVSHNGRWPAISGWVEDRLALDDGGTHFGFVRRGTARLSCSSGDFSLSADMYFAVPGALEINGGAGLFVTAADHRGFFHLGGPVEERGRLRYIDGCTDSLLIPPVLRGDPCLNLLHLPPGVRQTPHTHPSLRIGLVIRGAGHCITPEERIPLAPGQVFVIEANGLHCFQTDADELLVLAYHPDSDFGPTHEDHPMLNRTRISGREVDS